jgi:glycosyltransferase involved in cell wall biosynthesis
MRILHVVGPYPPAIEWGGTATAAAAMVDCLAAAGHDVTVFATGQRSTRTAKQAVGRREQGGAVVESFPAIHAAGRAFLSPQLLRALPAAVRRHDVVHVHLMWNVPEIAAAWTCRRAGVPYVLSPHGCLDPWSLSQRATEKRLLLAAAERRNVECAALLHFTAPAERELAPEWARRLPFVVVPNVVDAGAFEGRADDEARSGSCEILILGRIHEMKGFDTLVPALRRVLDQESRAQLVVAGPDEGGYRAKVERMIAANGVEHAVRFTGYLGAAARAEALARATMLVAPSYRENFGMVVAEAMAARLPVIVSPAVNIADDIAAAGAGLVVQKAVEPLADAILGLLRDPERRRTMGDAGRRLVAERYGPAAVAAGLVAGYEEAQRRGACTVSRAPLG